MLQDSSKKIDIELIPADNGIFDVALDGRLFYSKYDADRFPLPGEIAELLHALI